MLAQPKLIAFIRKLLHLLTQESPLGGSQGALNLKNTERWTRK